MSSTSSSILILRNSMFPPNDLRDKTQEIFMKKTKATHQKIEKILIDASNKKKASSEEFIKSYFRLIDGFIMDIISRKQVFSIEELNRQWKIYWRIVQGL